MKAGIRFKRLSEEDVNMYNGKYKHLFQPITINGMTVKNRLVMPPMGTNFANPDHSISEKYKRYFEARAKGGVGAIVVEYSCVHESGLSAPFQIGAFSDDHIKGMSEVAEIAHKYGVKVGMQIQHGGIQAGCAPGQAFGPSAMEGAREITKDEIKMVIAAFADAAERVKKAGMDFVQIHGASGYLVNQFMSPFYNKRTDEYGGDLEGLVRFPIEVYRAVRAKVGTDFPVTFRVVGNERVEGGCSVADRVEMVKRLEAEGIDAVHVAGGVLESIPYVIAPESVAAGYNLDAAEAIKNAVQIPVITVGRLHNPELADSVVASGKADMIALGRALIVDPEYPNKIASGREKEIRRCIYCLQHCLDIPAACTQNPDFGFEGVHDYQKAEISRRVMVVGSGPAGLEAAAVAARRGHTVTLVEKADHLGGQVTIADVPPYKHALENVIDYRVQELMARGVDVRTHTEADLNLIRKELPEVVVLATGADPIIPKIPGVDGDNVCTSKDILEERVISGKKVAVIGGGSVGTEVAEFIAAQQKDVTLIEMMSEFAKDMAAIPRIKLLERLQASTTMYADTKVLKFDGSSIEIERDGKTEILEGFDTIVLAIGYRPLDVLSEQIKAGIPNIEVHLIGDAAGRGRTIWNSIKEGGFAARNV